MVPLDATPDHPTTLIGFLQGRIAVPDDFDRMGEAQIADQFEGSCC
jgi:hypothetical protein